MSITGIQGVERGKTWYGPNETIDTAAYGQSIALEGSKRVFPDRDLSNNDGTRRSEADCVCILVRNVSGIALLPKRIVVWQTGQRFKRVAGYCATTAEECAGVVDEWLPAAGVRNGDLFWLVCRGPSLCLTSLAADAENIVTEFRPLYALTAATTQATTAGRFQRWNGTFSAAETTNGSAGNIIFNNIGRAMTARTTSNTNVDVLVDVDILKGG